MADYLPEVYQHFERRFPAVKEAFDALGAAEHDAGPLGERERRLIKLGIALAQSQKAACVRMCASCSVSGSLRRRSCIPSSSPSPPSVSLLPTQL
jgi:alkylhydroperoxidase/carboxymuconolactone decarboxylase family protein YurZ